MIKRMLIGFILVLACFGQSNFSNDLDGNIIAFHNIIPGKTTYSEAYDHLKYVVGIKDLTAKESDGIRFLKGIIMVDNVPDLGQIYTVQFNLDDPENPTVSGIISEYMFTSEELINNFSATGPLFLAMLDEVVKKYGEPDKEASTEYYKRWSFSSDIYESTYYLAVQNEETKIKVVELFIGKYK